jgi:hypothetical protein
VFQSNDFKATKNQREEAYELFKSIYEFLTVCFLSRQTPGRYLKGKWRDEIFEKIFKILNYW